MMHPTTNDIFLGKLNRGCAGHMLADNKHYAMRTKTKKGGALLLGPKKRILIQELFKLTSFMMLDTSILTPRVAAGRNMSDSSDDVYCLEASRNYAQNV